MNIQQIKVKSKSGLLKRREIRIEMLCYEMQYTYVKNKGRKIKLGLD